ncbi:MAG: hypothetical protein HN764_11340 [Gammaproteobacteria bacterium]|nr:hypothetical protein [Gammaproteobacteria bacterium]
MADYFALFGTSKKSEIVMQEIQFRLVDSLSSAPVIGARIRCFQKGRKKDVCFQRDSGKLGVVSMKIPRSKIISNSLLFEQSHHYKSSGSTELNIMFMHLDYQNQVARYDSDELFSKANEVHEVKMNLQYFEGDDNG